MGYYGWMLVAAVVTSLGGAFYLAGRLGLDRRRAAVCYLVAALAVFAGARGLYWLSQPVTPDEDSLASLLCPHPTRFALYGGLVAGMIAGVLAARVAGVDRWRLADAAAAPLAVGIAIVRLGCFARGCCHGLTSDLPWAISPAVGSPAYLGQVTNNPARVITGVAPIHPTQLYEMAAALLAATVVAVLIRRRATSGVPAIVGASLFTALRWSVLPLRDLGPTAQLDLWLYPIVYASLLGLFGVLLWRRIATSRPAKQESR